jgi:formylglycine-generating enzyme required for sulfatase activity
LSLLLAYQGVDLFSTLDLAESKVEDHSVDRELAVGNPGWVEEMQKRSEEEVGQQIDDLVSEDHRPALNQLFAAGEQRFRHVPAGGLVSYIYLTGTAEGISDLMRPSRQERDALLSNDRERISEQVEMILARAANEDEKVRLAESYRNRLEKIWDDPLGYTEDELYSVRYALAWFEIIGFRGQAREKVFQQRAKKSYWDAFDKFLEEENGTSSYIESACAPGYVAGVWQALKDSVRLDEEYQKLYAYLRILGEQFLPEMVAIPAGPFLMGSTDDDPAADDDGKPQHRVKLSEYHIGKYPVTNQEYQAFIQDSDQAPPGIWDGDQYPEGKGDHPVVYVTWYDAQAYCQWLSEKTGKAYRLPTEAEWEKAARGGLPSPEVGGGAGGGGFIYPWGDEWDPAKCNTEESGVGDTTPVGQYSPEGDSPYGCADMAGNVWEWCADWFDEDAYKNREDGVQDPQGPEGGDYRVLRGGSYYNDHTIARAACRDWHDPLYDFDDYLGFRVAASSRSIPEGGLSLSPLNSES